MRPPGQKSRRRSDAVAVDASSRYALISIQGPAAQSVLQTLTGVDLAAMKYYWFAHGEIAGIRVLETWVDGVCHFTADRNDDRDTDRTANAPKEPAHV